MLFFEIDRLRAVTETLLCVKSHHTAQLFSFSTTAFPIMFYSVLKSFLCIYCMYQLKKKQQKKMPLQQKDIFVGLTVSHVYACRNRASYLLAII